MLAAQYWGKKDPAIICKFGAWRRCYFIVQAADDAYGGSDTYRNRLSDGHDLIGQAMNTTVICGVFRSGGDSRFGFICDTIDMWVFSVPLGFISAFVLKLPPMWVYFLLCLDEFVKMPFVYKHYKSYKWLQNITRDDV